MRAINRPEPSEESISPATSGSSSRPDLVGEAPLTICRYSGMTDRPPNMAMPMMVTWPEATEKVRLRNIRSGSSASSPIRCWIQTNATRPTAPSK